MSEGERRGLQSCVSALLCDRARPTAPDFSEAVAAGDGSPPRDRMTSLIESHSAVVEAVSAERHRPGAFADPPTRSGDAAATTAAAVSRVPARIHADERGPTSRRTTTPTTAGDHDSADSSDKTTPPPPLSRNWSSVDGVSASAPASINVPYVVHPMVPGDPPAESYVVNIGNVADDLAAGGPQWAEDVELNTSLV